MNNLVKVLQEDDKAPDARQYFSESFNKETGGDFKKLLPEPSTRNDGVCIYWDLTMPNGSYVLTYCADDPFFVLHKVFDDE